MSFLTTSCGNRFKTNKDTGDIVKETPSLEEWPITEEGYFSNISCIVINIITTRMKCFEFSNELSQENVGTYCSSLKKRSPNFRIEVLNGTCAENGF